MADQPSEDVSLKGCLFELLFVAFCGVVGFVGSLVALIIYAIVTSSQANSIGEAISILAEMTAVAAGVVTAATCGSIWLGVKITEWRSPSPKAKAQAKPVADSDQAENKPSVGTAAAEVAGAALPAIDTGRGCLYRLAGLACGALLGLIPGLIILIMNVLSAWPSEPESLWAGLLTALGAVVGGIFKGLGCILVGAILGALIPTPFLWLMDKVGLLAMELNAD